jgi:hypothetical protein
LVVCYAISTLLTTNHPGKLVAEKMTTIIAKVVSRKPGALLEFAFINYDDNLGQELLVQFM